MDGRTTKSCRDLSGGDAGSPQRADQGVRRMRRTIPVLGAVVLVLALGPPAHATSGDLFITTDTTLSEDHQGKIVVAADDVTLDCAGHLVTGTGEEFVIVIDGRSGVTVQDCRITAGENGLGVSNSTGVVLRGNEAIENEGAGFALFSHATGTRLTGNLARSNAGSGFVLYGASHNLLRGNVARDNGDGFRIVRGSGNMLRGNRSAHNGYGFALFRGASDSTVVKNRAVANRAEGFALLFGTSGNRVVRNVSLRNLAEGISIFFASKYNVVRANVITRNANSGVLVYKSFHNSIARNRSMLNNANLLDNGGGISVVAASRANAILRNVACRNGNADGYTHGAGHNTWRHNAFCTTNGL